MSRFDGSVAVVTGAAGGIGAETARHLGADGATVACLDVRLEPAEATAAAIVEAGGKARAFPCDVSDEQSVTGAVDAVVGELGPPKVLANVAGIGWFQHTLDAPLSDWNKMIGVNLTGTFLVSRACIGHFLGNGGGSIVNVASTAGITGQPYSAAYCASKGGVVMLTKALAWEYIRKNIRVNAVSPGGIETDILSGFTPPEGANMRLIGKLQMPNGFGQPSDVARLISFVASDEARYMTGTVIPIDGGMTA